MTFDHSNRSVINEVSYVYFFLKGSLCLLFFELCILVTGTEQVLNEFMTIPNKTLLNENVIYKPTYMHSIKVY